MKAQNTVLQLVAKYFQKELFKAWTYKVVFNKEKTKFVILYAHLGEMLHAEYGVNNECASASDNRCIFIFYGCKDTFSKEYNQEQIKNQNFEIPVYIL